MLELTSSIVAIGHSAPNARAYLKEVSTLLTQAVPVDALLAIRQPSLGGWVSEHALGVSNSTLKRLQGNWGCYRQELAPVFERAALSGAAVDSQEMGARLHDTRYFAEIAAPQRANSTAIVLLRWQTASLGAFVLGRRREFSSNERDLLCLLAPSLALGLAAHTSTPDDREPMLQSLTPSEREVVSYVCLGFTNKEIATACGISANRVRNKLVRIFRRLEVSTRAELSALAVRHCAVGR
jgi:DNA-binding CsgD family transcriptional regulator